MALYCPETCFPGMDMMAMLKPLLLVLACALAAAPPPSAKVPMPPLEQGEGLALAGTDKELYLFGDTQGESPMGQLAYLPWMKLEGSDWGTRNPFFKCEGVMNGEACSTAKGHGRVDLRRAVAEGCDLAILHWARMTALDWRANNGEGAARAQLEETFGPFLGRRLPPGDGLPPLDGAWVGDGGLLRTSPAALIAWLADPAQEQLLRDMRRLLLNPVKETYVPGAWWVLLATAEVPSQPGVYASWAVGSNDRGVAVLRLPPGKGRAEALARFQAVLMIPGGQLQGARPGRW